MLLKKYKFVKRNCLTSIQPNILVPILVLKKTSKILLSKKCMTPTGGTSQSHYLPESLALGGPYSENGHPISSTNTRKKNTESLPYRSGFQKLTKGCKQAFTSFVILSSPTFEDLRGAWPRPKTPILQFRSCKISETRLRFLETRYTIWPSKSFERPLRTFYFTLASSTFEVMNILFEFL